MKRRPYRQAPSPPRIRGAARERRQVKALFEKLCRQPMESFPPPRGRLTASCQQGVYVIRDHKKRVVHVGRSRTGKRGLRQRLNNHLHGASSFVIHYLEGDGSRLRRGYTFQCIEIPGRRSRALVEALAAGLLCPLHIDGKRDAD
jgi:hypothetical protein